MRQLTNNAMDLIKKTIGKKKKKLMESCFYGERGRLLLAT